MEETERKSTKNVIRTYVQLEHREVSGIKKKLGGIYALP